MNIDKLKREKIKDIQQAKIKELQDAGIDQKYLYEINKKTVSFWAERSKLAAIWYAYKH